MDLQHLATFVAVAETHGFSAAAQVLNLTQSAVSAQISKLERDLGVRLFERTTRSVVLTDAGITLLPYARRLLNLSDTASSLVSGEGNRPALRLGITTEQADQFLPEILRRFTALHPQVGVQIDCSVSSVLARKLADGLLDVALTIRHADTPAGETIDIEDLVWIAHPDMQWDRDSALPIAANPEGCIHRAHAIDALARAGLDWTVRYVSDSAAAVNATVAAGLAVAVKSRRSIPQGMVEIDEVFDLPALAPVTVDLHRAPTAVTQADDDLVSVVREVCGRRSALSAT